VFRLAATDAPAGDLDRSAVEQPALLSRMTQPASVRWFLGRTPWKAGAVAAVVLLLAGVTVYWARSAGNTVAAGNSRSIAVLPFHNLSGGKTDEVFADGLTEDLIDSLVRVPGLHVVARTSAFQFKGKTVDVRKIGRDLAVRTILEAASRPAAIESVLRPGWTMRPTATTSGPNAMTGKERTYWQSSKRFPARLRRRWV